MILRKFLGTPFLFFIFLFMFVGVASGGSILSSANQICQIVSPSGNNGSFPISSMLAVGKNGQLTNIPSTMPTNQVFIATKITGYFIADDPITGGAVFNLGDYYRMGPQLNGGFCSFNDVIAPGIPITGLGATVYIHRSEDATKTALPGKLNLRVMGYLANIN